MATLQPNARFFVAGIASAGLVGLLVATVFTDNVSLPNAVKSSASVYAAEQLDWFTDIEETGKVVQLDLVAAPTIITVGGVRINSFAYNGQVPGPEIRVKLGDTVRVKFTNQLPQETTIHWHGVRVPNAMDGVPGVTQSSVKPGESFTYEFVPKDAGTYWYHPHVNTDEQMERGLYGTLIVEDETANEFDRDITWVIDDWLIRNNELYPHFSTMHDLAHDGRWGNLITVNGQVSPTLNMQPNELVRLRLINVANARVIAPQLRGLETTVIAIDGLPVFDEISLEDLDLAPGNRIDLAVQAPAVASSRSFTLVDTFTRQANTVAHIAVIGSPLPTRNFDWHYTPASQWEGIENEPVDEVVELDAEGMHMMGISWLMNGRAFPNHQPIEASWEEFRVIELVNKSSRLHPMHIHGQFFRVISRNSDADIEPNWRDTVLVGPRERVRIALAPLEKGEWAFHCHALEHAEAGMITILSVE